MKQIVSIEATGRSERKRESEPLTMVVCIALYLPKSASGLKSFIPTAETVDG